MQLLEGAEYRYELEVESAARSFSSDRPEILQRDTETGETGRIRTGLYTGSMPLRILQNNDLLGTVYLEIRSRKLDYRNDYRWMLRDLAESFAEILMQKFAVSDLNFSPDASRDPSTAYQQFAFLSSFISSESFKTSLSQILSRPFIRWDTKQNLVAPGRGIKSSSQFARQIGRVGPLTTWHRAPGSLPEKISQSQTEAEIDNIENRFIKYVIQQWHSLVLGIHEILDTQTDSPQKRRGKRECSFVIDELDAVLNEDFFKEVGPLTATPLNNQVLQRRVGYRDIYRAFLEFEVASQLSWEGGEDLYKAGQRDVATLYEYWVFIRLAEILSEVIDVPFDFEKLLQPSSDKLNIGLKQGSELVLSGNSLRFGRSISVDFWFNKSFSVRSSGDSTWSRPMRPDFSLRLRPEGYGNSDETWVHFDAKYRLDAVSEAFGEAIDQDDSNSKLESRPLREDLLKMHAYRDAIRRSSGAYVLYPGNASEQCFEFHELLPGLGAFGFRPSESGESPGRSSIMNFMNDVLDHISDQLTQHERGRYWIRESYRANELVAPVLKPLIKILEKPPADTNVLIGYVKNAAQKSWILDNGLYNLRADKRRGSISLGSHELGAEIAVLYCPKEKWCEVFKVYGSPYIKTSQEMDGYPSPSGNVYICLPIKRIEDANLLKLGLSAQKMVELRKLKTPIAGNPIITNWSKLMEFVD